MTRAMPAPRLKSPVPAGFEVLQGLQPLKPATRPKQEVSSDHDVVAVKRELERIAGGEHKLAERLGKVLRRALDRSYDGMVTGRFHLAQLSKTEKAHTGSLFEVELQKELDLPDGHVTDYQVLGMDVDAKYTHSRKGSTANWMIGPEIEGNIALVATADDYQSVWSAWLVWVTPGRRLIGKNRDAKAGLNQEGKGARIPIAESLPLPPNVLLQRPQDAYEVMKIKSGQQRILELCRRFEGALLSRTTIATVAKQLDPLKRMRGDQGARSLLAPEGFIIIGNEAQYKAVTGALALPHPAKGEFLSLRVVPADSYEQEPTFADASGIRWRRAKRDEPSSAVPQLPEPKQ